MNTREQALAAAARLQLEGAPFALVTVLRVEAPASARPGDKAVVTTDGHLHGWVGGGCSQPAVLRAARLALADGRTRIVRIAPTGEPLERELGDVLEFGMTCHSGGALELFIDPVCARPQLVVIGRSAVALGLTQLAPRVGFAVTVVAHEAMPGDFPDAGLVLATDDAEQVRGRIPPGAWVVVATQGRRDVQGLRLALRLEAAEVSFVASARKASVLRDALLAAGESPGAVQAIVAPAGYPMAAGTPEEIALSVLAAVVAQRRSRRAAGGDVAQAAPVVSAADGVDAPAATGSGCCGGGPAVSALLDMSLKALADEGSGHAVAQPVIKSEPSSGCCGGGH